MVLCLHYPSDPEKQPWASLGFAGLFGALSGMNTHMAIFQNTMDDYNEAAPVYGGNYTPIWLTLRKALETNDINNDGKNNTDDLKTVLNTSTNGYAAPVFVSALSAMNQSTDENVALVAEIAPQTPYIVYRNIDFPDSIKGSRLYVANAQIARNNTYHFCDRYVSLANTINKTTNSSEEDDWKMLCEESSLPHCLMTMQYTPSSGRLNLSVYDSDNNQPAYLISPTQYNIHDLLNE